jgi:hypothetical protein
MRRNLKTLAVIFSVVLNVTFAASYAWRRFHNQPRFAYEELDLTHEQRTRFEAGRVPFIQHVNRIGNAMIARNIELMDSIAAEPGDVKAIHAKLAEIRSNVQSMQDVVVKHLLEDKQILDAGQRKQFFDVLKARIRAQGAPGPAWIPRGARTRED